MASITRKMCTCQVCNNAKIVLDNIFNILNSYGWLLDAYIVDFFHDDLWSKLPEAWKTLLVNVSPEDLGSFILGESTCNCVWPLSLLALRKVIGMLEINREPGDKVKFVCAASILNYDSIANCTDDKLNSIKFKNEYEKHFRKHIKEKKRHEIDKFAKICAKCSYLSKCECIIDTGAGLGHLARELTYKYNLPVICIEQNKSLSDLAEKHDKQLQQILKKQLNINLPSKSPYHMCAKIIDKNSEQIKLIEDFNAIITKKFELDVINVRYGLIGLHPCGDLASTLLKLYVKQDAIKFISVVGCCYMKLTVRENNDTNSVGYPLSNYVSNKYGNNLSYAALEVSCHAIENYCDKMKKGQYNDLKVHAFRAALEMILINKYGMLIKHSRVTSVKVKDDMTFSQYCKLATAKFTDDKQLTDIDIEHPKVLKCLKLWRRVVLFEAIRFMLAPLVETAVLLDRFLYLSDNGLKPILKAEFDPRRSPRNFVLMSIK
ncbi:hypothetical protein PV327_008276 [Microctonus hyperodae]|uniref:Methyltransferase domain-containing protein n=1 Tax=Microctonus hyperodae TaxID=165561 RepID=A0AA39F2S8_MICHY|nr:hypothetical protein PV327_008276 [Microctonus hyperodae]